MTSPSNSSGLDFTPNVDEIESVEDEEMYYEQNDLNYTHPIEEILDSYGMNVDTNADNVAAPRATYID